MRPQRRVEICQEYLQVQRKKEKVAFFSLADEWILPAASTMKLEGSSKDLNSVELETVRMSKNPTMVMTANGEVLTKEEATVYVRGLDLFVTVMHPEDTPAVLSLGKLCEDHGYSYEWTSGRMVDEYNAERKTMYRSLSLVHRQVLLLHLHLLLLHLHRKIL